MASTTKETEAENVSEKVIVSDSHFINRGKNIYLNNSVNASTTIDANHKESLRKRVLQSNEGTVKKRKSFVKKFRKEWMDEPIFRGWLQPIPNRSEKCWCSVCNVVLLCGHSELEKHASGKKHSDLMLLHQLKGDLMDTNSSPAILDINLEDCKKEDSSMDSADLTVVPSLELSGDSGDSQLVFHVTQDGTLVEMKMEDYEKLTQTQEVETVTSKKSLHKGNVINVGSTTITKGSAPSLTKLMPAILRQSGKQIVKVQANQSSVTQKVEEEKRNNILLDHFGTDTDDDDFDDDDYISDSQQMIKEMKAEAAYQEKKLIDQKRQETEVGKSDFSLSNSKIKESDEIYRFIAEKELEVRLHHLQERRRQRFNIYKLKLQEMDARVKAAELELARAEELHKLRVKHLQLQIVQQEQYGQQESI